MKRFFVILLMLTMSFVIQAQEANPTPIAAKAPPPPKVVVQVGDAFIRAAPSLEEKEIGSVFLDDPLEVIGRNADGTWFEVRRPGRRYNLGWIFNKMVDWEFRVEDVPMTNNTTGLLGPDTVEDTGFAVFVLQNSVLRTSPDRTGRRITTVPLLTTVPLIERNQDGSWIKINYLGHVGWVVSFATRVPDNLMAVPLGANLPPIPERIIIPPEIQLAQIERMRTYVTVNRDVASGLATFWDVIAKGQTMPCEPPPFVNAYLLTDRDVQELPEQDRYISRMTVAIDAINDSIVPLTQCGVIDLLTVTTARANAINARIILDNNLVQLKNVEDIINSQIDK